MILSIFQSPNDGAFFIFIFFRWIGLISSERWFRAFFYQYRNPNNQRGILFLNPVSIPSAAIKLFFRSLI